uniref:Uncharacterized protein n=1 Tax=Ditylenchus dipsaci TaxID=166011 RepID=A0A915EL91_9BILA
MEEQAGGSCAGSIPLNTLQDNISEEALNAALADGGLGGAGSAPAIRECYNSSPEPDEESNQEDDLEQLIRLHAEDFARPSIGVQTDYDDNFPP